MLRGLVSPAFYATLWGMKMPFTPRKRIVAALCLSVGISLPVSAQTDRIADLLNQLSEAEGVQAARLAVEIQTEWSKSGSPAIDLLMRRGDDALDEGDAATAVEHYTAAIDHAPDFVEAYHGRANAYYMTGNIGPALQDLRLVLSRNPNHWDAMFGFAIILTEMGEEAEALEVLRQVLAIYPADEDAAFVAQELEIYLEGTAL